MGNDDKNGWIVEMTHLNTPETIIHDLSKETYMHAYKRTSRWFPFYSGAVEFAEQESKSKDKNEIIIVMPFLIDTNKGED